MLEKTGQTRERENGSTQRDVVTGWTRKILRRVVLATAPREGERAPVRTAPRNGIPGNRGAGAVVVVGGRPGLRGCGAGGGRPAVCCKEPLRPFSLGSGAPSLGPWHLIYRMARFGNVYED